MTAPLTNGATATAQTAGETTSTRLVLDAVDGLFFRGGRAFGHGASLQSRLPLPQTLAGAVRTFVYRRVGVDLQRLGAAVRGGSDLEAALHEAGAPDWACHLEVRGPHLGILPADGDAEPLFPTPANLVYRDPDHKGRKGRKGRGSLPDRDGNPPVIVRLDPLDEPPPGWQNPDGLRPLWSRHPSLGKPVGGFLRPEGAKAWCAGGVPAPEDVVSREDLVFFEPRTGLALDEQSLTGKEGMLYSVQLLRPRTEVCGHDGSVGRAVFLADVRWPEGGPPPRDLFPEGSSLLWGGERRRARIQTTDPPPATAAGPEIRASGRSAHWLLTPAIFRQRWRPDHDHGLVAAAVPGATAVSGWDLARRAPKPNRFAVAAGSVFFFEANPNEAGPSTLCEDAELRAQGWAVSVTGGWNHG